MRRKEAGRSRTSGLRRARTPATEVRYRISRTPWLNSKKPALKRWSLSTDNERNVLRKRLYSMTTPMASVEVAWVRAEQIAGAQQARHLVCPRRWYTLHARVRAVCVLRSATYRTLQSIGIADRLDLAGVRTSFAEKATRLDAILHSARVTQRLTIQHAAAQHAYNLQHDACTDRTQHIACNFLGRITCHVHHETLQCRGVVTCPMQR